MTQKARQRSASGSDALRAQHLFPSLHSSLYRLALSSQLTPKPPAPPEPKPINRRVLLTDEQVREFRTLRERDGWSLKELARKFDVTYQYALNLSKYQTRSRIFPDL